MSFKVVTASLILAVLPAVAAAQSATQPAPATPPNTPPQVLSPAAQAAAGRSRAAANARALLTPGQGQGTIASNRVPEAAPFTPPARPAVPNPVSNAVPNAVPRAVPATVSAAIARSPVAAPAVTAALPASPTVAMATPGIQPVAAPTAATPLAAGPSDPGTSMAIDYRQGQLSLVADHAPLGKLLALVAARTGASIDIAPEMAQELVAARLGPATPNEVLTSLLDGPKLDYIILGSNDQGGVMKVIVRRKKSFMGQPAMAAAMASRQAAQQQNQTAEEAQASEPAPADGTAAPQQENPPVPK